MFLCHQIHKIFPVSGGGVVGCKALQLTIQKASGFQKHPRLRQASAYLDPVQEATWTVP